MISLFWEWFWMVKVIVKIIKYNIEYNWLLKFSFWKCLRYKVFIIESLEIIEK